MQSEQITIGTRVRVNNYREPGLLGLAGTVEQMYGDPGYRALEVRLENGRSELFWHHELDEEGKIPVRTSRGPGGQR